MLFNGIGMGISVLVILTCCNIVISAMRKVIPNDIRIAVFVVIIAGFVTIVDLLLQAYIPALSESLGVFIPLIVVNCIILARAEGFASKNGPVASFFDGLGNGLGFTMVLCIMGAVRELLGSGTILGMTIMPEAFPKTLLLIMAPGAFFTLGIFMAIFKSIAKKPAEPEEEE